MNSLDPLRHAHRFCPRCSTPMTERLDNGRVRPVCPACGYVQYLNPSPAGAAILFREGMLCLVQRKFPPKAGQWTLPAGFQEYDEEIEECVVREVREETGLEVRLDGLFAVHTGVLPPDHPVLLVVYRAVELGGSLCAGDDAASVGFYGLDDLPGEVAFASHRKVIAALRDERDRRGDPRAGLGGRADPTAERP